MEDDIFDIDLPKFISRHDYSKENRKKSIEKFINLSIYDQWNHPNKKAQSLSLTFRKYSDLKMQIQWLKRIFPEIVRSIHSEALV